MGNILSYFTQDTVITIWRKHEQTIEKKIIRCVQCFKDKYCIISPEAYCTDYRIIITAFDEYVRKHLPQQ